MLTLSVARPLRIQIKDGWYHVTARGNRRQMIYLDPRDRAHFLELLGEMVERHALEVHSYVLMDNHYHLLVRTPQANLSAALQWLNVAYSVWWNRRHREVGHLFQGRFKAVVIQAGQWVLEASLYLHLNPIAISALELSKSQKGAEKRGWHKPRPEFLRQRLERLRVYPWSSYRAYAGYGPKAEWLNLSEILERAGGPSRYRELVEERVGQGVQESLWGQLHWGLVLGSETFARKLKGQLHVSRESAGRRQLSHRCSWAEVVRAVERERGEKWTQFAHRYGDWGLGLALYVARRCTGLSLRALGEAAGGMDYKAVYMQIQRFARRLAKEKGIAKVTQKITSELEYNSG